MNEINGSCGNVSVSSNQFYGSNMGRKFTSLEKEVSIKRRMRDWHSRPVPKPVHYSILGPSSTWKVSPTQLQAINWARESALTVFSYESEAFGTGGKRSFLVADAKNFFGVFKNRPLQKRTAYEVIAVHCRSKLYFDLEFENEYNKTSDGVAMTQVLINIVKFYIKKCFGVTCSENEIINLNSSSETKFSKHLIFNFKSIVFKDNHHAGNFVRMLFIEIEKIVNDFQPEVNVSSSDLETLFIYDKDGTKKSFCDMSVYSRNRNFRIYKATKYGKNRPLELAQESCIKSTNDTEIFLDSLITYIPENCKTISYGNDRDSHESVLFLSSGLSTVGNAFSGACSLQGFVNTSPYEELDKFISEQVVPGYIKQWKYYQQSQTMAYCIEKFRYCHNVGREHKSNGILLIVSINKKVWYQKCLDPDCLGFKSAEWSLPDNALPWYHLEEEFPNFIKNVNMVKLSHSKCHTAVSGSLTDGWDEQDNWMYDVETE